MGNAAIAGAYSGLKASMLNVRSAAWTIASASTSSVASTSMPSTVHPWAYPSTLLSGATVHSFCGMGTVVVVVVSGGGAVVDVTGASVVTGLSVVVGASVVATEAASLGVHAVATSPATKTMTQTRDMAESIRQTPGLLASLSETCFAEGRQKVVR